MGKTDALKSLRESKYEKKKEVAPVEVVKPAKQAPKKAAAKVKQPPIKEVLKVPQKRGPKPRSGVTRTRNTITTDQSVWDAFMTKHRGKVSLIIEGWMKKDLGRS